MTFGELSSRSSKKARGLGFGFLTYGGGRAFRQEQAMLLPTVYRCVEIITDSIAQLPLKPYKVDARGYRSEMVHPIAHLINCEPNARMTRFVFIKTLCASVLLNGNGYAYIQRDGKGVPVALHFIPAEYVTIELPQYLEDPVSYTVAGLHKIPAADMIHVINFSYDGVQGVSTLTHAANTLGLAQNAEAQASGFFKGGCNVGGILTVQSVLTEKQREVLKETWKNAFDPASGTPNGVAVLSGDMKYQGVTVNPKDAMLLESRMFSVIDICRFFGVSPTKCFDFSKSSYNTLEQTNLSFLSDTLSPILEKFRLEFERKLFPSEMHDGVEVRFDTNQLLRGDKAAQANFYSTLFSLGSITPNEIRREVDLPPLPDGDRPFVQVNMQPLDRAVRPPEPTAPPASPVNPAENEENPDDTENK